MLQPPAGEVEAQVFQPADVFPIDEDLRDRQDPRQAGLERPDVLRAGGEVDFLEIQPVFAHQRLGGFAVAAVGAREVLLSGAGPSLFAVPPSREVGLAWQLLLEARGWRATLTRPWRPPEPGVDDG